MSKTFRPWPVEQRWLLPPSVQELVPPEHIAHFIRDTVRDVLDLSEIHAAYNEERGFPPYHPTMMTALLLYAYCHGVFSSRRIARACQERVDFMAVTAMNQPDFRTVSDFRKRHLQALARLFHQVLRLCQHAKMVRLGHVALDGTKLKANASKHKAMSYGRMGEAEERIEQEVAELLAAAEEADAQEDAEHGKGRRGDELPKELARRETRLAKIREAKAALEAEARAKAEAKQPKATEPPEPPPGPTAAPVQAPSAPRADEAKPDPKAQRATSPTRSRASCPTAPTRALSCRRTTSRSRWTPRRRSSWPST